jgi:hypothetical protein
VPVRERHGNQQVAVELDQLPGEEIHSDRLELHDRPSGQPRSCWWVSNARTACGSLGRQAQLADLSLIAPALGFA